MDLVDLDGFDQWNSTQIVFQLIFAGLHFAAILHALATAYHLRKALKHMVQ